MTDIRLDRLPEVLSRRGDGRTSLYSDIKRIRWTPPIHVGRASTWPRHETDALIRARIAGATDDQLRALVRDLLSQRKSLMPAIGASEAA
ncbi:MAG: helix-turn-helix transcriptional regulator [Chloroflexota bacterium]